MPSRLDVSAYFGSLGPQDTSIRLEEFCHGTPASVSFLCGPAKSIPLEPCLQKLSDDDSFAYLGGKLPLDPPLRERAITLASNAINAMPKTVGYVGVDLVLGHAVDGSEDFVIEINPRLTTSYLGLRRLCRNNPALAMLSIASGKNIELSFRCNSIEFAL